MIYSKPIKTLANCDGRYPTEAEEGAVLNWAYSLPKRLQAANQLAQKEQDIVREAIDEMKPMYPRFPAQHDRAYEKGARDLQLVLRYAVQGMIVDDADMPQEKLFIWYGTIIRGLGLTPQFTRDSCQAVYAACRRHLSEELFEVASPYLRRMVDDVPAFPEPMKPAVH
ncbi:MAG: hypothetical protein ACRCZF_17200 [Gemmataceae bacterium]